ncbi:MAG: hypothetical protein RL018_543, partial [Pseudomonadota bacterium]
MEKRRSDLAPYKFFATLLAWVVGTWLQLSQASLSDAVVYVCFIAVAFVFVLYIAINNVTIKAQKTRLNLQIWRLVCMCLASACLAFGVTGLRAVDYASHQLQAAYEGRDIEVV